MSLRNRLTLLVGGVVAITVALVTWTVSASARRAFETMDARRTAASIAQFRREVANEGDEVVRRVDRITASDAVRHIAIEFRPSSVDRDVNEAVPLANAVMVAVEPDAIIWLSGWVVMPGATPMVTAAVFESAVPDAFDTRTQ